MAASLAPLWIMIVFAMAGVIIGVAQLHMERWCPYCHLAVTWKVSNCPHCRSRLDNP